VFIVFRHFSKVLGRGVWPAVGCCAAALATAGSGAAQTVETRLVRLGVPGGELQAYVAPAHGADLAGLEVRHGGRWSELLYRGMDYQPIGGWTGKAPILWPAVGRNFPYTASDRGHGGELGWVLHGRFYVMPLHGFARDQPWRIVRQGRCAGSAFLVLGLGNTGRTRGMYPFGFTLTTEYRIWRDSLYIRQAVHAQRTNVEPMPFSVGNHITFRIPLLPDDDPLQTAISTPATEQVITDGTGRPTGRIVTVDYATPRPLSSFRPLTPISLSGYATGQEWVRLQDPGFAVVIAHSEDRRPSGTPVLFNLWGDVSQGYFAPEPWVGKQNSLVTGDGTIRLQPGETFRWTIAVRLEAGVARATESGPTLSAPTCLE
jgi:galactose mutarotase-like enzyme